MDEYVDREVIKVADREVIKVVDKEVINVLNLRAGKEEKEDPPYYEDLDSQLRLTSARRNI